jgi:4-hydroxybenzoate polyprenyltransferase
LQPDVSLTSRALNLLGMMHLPSCLLMGFAVVLGEAIASPIIPAQAAFSGFMTGFLLLGTHMVLDDLDREINSDNQPTRIRPVGVVKRNEGFSFAIVLASFGLLFAAYLGLSTLLIALLSAVVIFVHHAKTRKPDVLGNAFVGANTAIIFIYAGFAVGSLTRMLAIFVAMAFLSSMGREAMKNLAQSLKDSSVRAVSVTASNRYTEAGKQSALLFVATVMLSVVPLVLRLVSINYIPLIAICDVGFLLTAYSMMTSPTPRNAKRNENYVLVWLSFGLFAFVIGTI